jgi:hypothetical protein
MLKSSMVCDTTLREIIERIGVCGSEWIIQHTNKIAMKKPYPRFDIFVSGMSSLVSSGERFLIEFQSGLGAEYWILEM